MNGKTENNVGKMTEELRAFYENAGFTNFYQRILRHISDAAVRELYALTFDRKPA